ncbi:MAG: Rieske 2Fe-2S domain-containing protein [Rhodospirillaceae bacterium]|jgi:benzoate/toluate 1,2-dioxygenase subunit alpha|nr:Rieske 2Fe-2S domain-containing protein [Rhodospirillaceae bacterium]MBT5457121.1 Rieske 2Fe-2S domain-containing protein [Rhodospirillaceae bacterium]
MADGGTNSTFADLVDDRPDERVFRVDRSVYTDAEIFDKEIERLFENGWVYLCHESQVKDAGCFYATEIGRQPVVVIRQKDGEIRAFINACSHRGALLTPTKQGKAIVLTCRFHGWSYNCDGRCVRIKNEKDGYGEDDFERSQYDLTPIARMESYRGFVFGSLVEDVPPIDEYLGASKTFMDLLIDQSPEGLEVVPGSSTYVIQGNWKMQIENAVDGYHVSTVHRVFAATVGARDDRDDAEGMRRTEGGRIKGNVPTGGYDLGHGHMLIWATHTTPEVRPIYQQKERLEKQFPPEKVRWILERGRNLALFPNVMVMDNPSTQIRKVKPISADRFEVTVYCIAPIGESREARAARLRKFEDFYLTSGMATSDDLAALEDTFLGSMATRNRWNDYGRGWSTKIDGPDEDARAIGCDAVTSSSNWDYEMLFHGFWRHWRDRMGRVARHNGAES